MSKLTLNDITSGYASTTLLNSNNAAIEAALENTLSRDGTGPNQMNASLDMNGYAILNQRATSGNENFIWAGAWATGTTYQQNNLIYASEGTYLGYGLICITAHTSGATLDGDSANWDIYVEKGATVGGLTGPASSTNNYLSQWNGTSGTALKEGVPIGASGGVQAYSAKLSAYVNSTLSAANKIPYATALDTASELDFKDEDDMASNSATAVPSQQSVKAYVDAVSNNIPVRQTVLSGPVDSSGYPAFGGSTGATTVTVSGTLQVTAAVGGVTNYIGTITNPSWTGLSTNGTSYLYVDITSGGAVTTGYSTLAPIYQWGGTYSITAGQNTFNIQEMTMKEGNGSSAVQVYRTFVGEVTIAGGVVTAILWYAIMGRYTSPIFAISSNTNYTYNHNIGSDAKFLNAEDRCGPSSTDVGYEGYRAQAEAGTVYGFHKSNLTKTAITLNVLNMGRSYYGGTATHAILKVSRTW